MLDTPTWYAADCDDEGVLFWRLERTDYDEAVFLDERMPVAGRTPSRRVSWDELHTRLGEEAPCAWPHIIAHTSYCCSTLLVKQLGRFADAWPMSEPPAYVRLALTRTGPGHRRRLALLHRLMARTYAPGARAIVKLPDASNVLIEDIAELAPESRFLLVYSDLATFVRSVLRNERRRRWIRDMGPGLVRLTGTEVSLRGPASDAVLAAWTWCARMRLLIRLADGLGERVRTIDCDDYLAARPETGHAAAGFFGLHGLPRPSGVLEEHAKGGLRHAQPVSYGPAERAREHAAIAAAFPDEIAAALRWGEEHGAAALHEALRARRLTVTGAGASTAPATGPR